MAADANNFVHVDRAGSVACMRGQRGRLIRYLDGRLEIDDNGAENAIRPFVVGCKNWLFSEHRARKAKVSASLYGLLETANTNDLAPFTYLRHLFERIPAARILEEFDALLPWNRVPRLAQKSV
ncbi:MAG: transposase domain-containing protein [Magnetococcales bacterium]|nr:transposase domain-containing protein [Magnetococcales bacterium]